MMPSLFWVFIVVFVVCNGYNGYIVWLHHKMTVSLIDVMTFFDIDEEKDEEAWNNYYKTRNLFFICVSAELLLAVLYVWLSYWLVFWMFGFLILYHLSQSIPAHVSLVTTIKPLNDRLEELMYEALKKRPDDYYNYLK
jgi:hypothetical protein